MRYFCYEAKSVIIVYLLNWSLRSCFIVRLGIFAVMRGRIHDSDSCSLSLRHKYHNIFNFMTIVIIIFPIPLTQTEHISRRMTANAHTHSNKTILHK